MKKVYWLSALGLLSVTFGAMGFVLFIQTHYFPLLQVRFTDQTVLTFVDNPWTSLAKCQSSHQKIRDQLSKTCPDCQIRIDRCDTQLAEPWMGILQGRETTHAVVHSGSLHMVVEAPNNHAKTTCEAMATQIRQTQQNGAHCTSP